MATWDRGWATRGRFGDKRVAEIAPYARWARRRKIVWFGDLVENGVLMSLSRVRERFPAVGNTEWDSRREQKWYDAVERYWSTEMGGKLGEQVGIEWKRPRDGREGGLGLEGYGGIVWAFGDGSKDPSKAGSPVGWGVRVYKNDGWGTGDILWEEAGGLESIGGGRSRTTLRRQERCCGQWRTAPGRPLSSSGRTAKWSGTAGRNSRGWGLDPGSAFPTEESGEP